MLLEYCCESLISSSMLISLSSFAANSSLPSCLLALKLKYLCVVGCVHLGAAVKGRRKGDDRVAFVHMERSAGVRGTARAKERTDIILNNDMGISKMLQTLTGREVMN